MYIRAGGALDPKILTNRTLGVRLGVLKEEIDGPNGQRFKLFRDVPGRLEFALQKPGFDINDVEQFLQEVVEERYLCLDSACLWLWINLNTYFRSEEKA